MGTPVKPPSVDTLAKLQTLTRRQREVADLIAQGHTHAEIGDRLCITEWSVKNHAAEIQKKLGVRSSLRVARIVIWDEALRYLERHLPHATAAD